MMTAGAASRTGYNFEFGEGKFIVQPQILLGYTFVNTFDYTTASGAKIDSDPLNAFQIQPGIKFIGNLGNGWQPYAGVDMTWNIMSKSHYVANESTLPKLAVKPYVQYGVGVQKHWGDRFTAYGQAMLRNGGRTGISLQAGLRWTIGKDPKKEIEETKNSVKKSDNGKQVKKSFFARLFEKLSAPAVSNTVTGSDAKKYIQPKNDV